MQYKNWEFASNALKYVKSGAENILGPPVFRPDGKTPTQIGTVLSTGQTLFTELTTREQELDAARAALHQATKEAHDACVAVFSCMKSCYRSDDTLLAAIKRFPTDDQSPKETLSRIKAMHGFWTDNPTLPGSSTPFVVGQTDLETFTELFDELDEKESAFNTCDGKRASQARAFANHLRTISQFVTHALVQGRAAYRKGSADREYIDAIPTRPTTQAPGEVEFTAAESNGPGQSNLDFAAPHATRFTVLHKGPGDQVFAVVQDGDSPQYRGTGLTAGVHDYKVIPHNSRGSGEGAIVSITIAAGASQAVA